MELPARAETWLRVYAGKLLGPPAAPADEVDHHGLFVLSSVAQALAVLEILDVPTIDAVFGDLGIAAGMRGRRMSANEVRSPEGFFWQAPASAPVAGAAAGTSSAPPVVDPWPPETFDAGALFEIGGAVVQILWVTRTPAGCVAPVRVRFGSVGPATAMLRPRQVAATMAVSVPFGPGLPGVEVVDGAGGVHQLAWPLAQGDGTSSWGTAEMAPDLPRSPATLQYRVAGQLETVASARFEAPAPDPVGRCEDRPGSPGERYLDWWAGRVAAETCEALRDLGIVGRGYVRAAERAVPSESPAPDLASWPRVRPPSLAVPAAARAVGVMLPLRRPAVYVEGLTMEEGRVVVHARVRKVAGSAPALWWEAEDASGRRRPVRVMEGWHGGGPAALGVEVPLAEGEDLRQLRLVAATPFEAAHVDLALPAHPPAPAGPEAGS